MRPRTAFTILVAAVGLAAVGGVAVANTASSNSQTGSPPQDTTDTHEMDKTMKPADRVAAMLAAAGFQDVTTAEAAGYASSLDALGCFQDPTRGGMGVHYINQALMDDKVDITKPEALVYELDAAGHITGLVAHEYIVPIDAWHKSTPPNLFGMPFHKHPSLPLWILHTWLWKDNPRGVFQDWNPAVRQCPAGVPIFGQDPPQKALTQPTQPADPPATEALIPVKGRF